MKRLIAVLLFGSVLIIIATVFILPPDRIKDASISGIQIRSHIWSGTIMINEDTYFVPWTSLTIERGTKVLFEKKPDVDGTDWTKNADDFIKRHNDPTGRKGYGSSHFELVGKINATGTKDEPIIFTSAQAKPEYADWNQLVLLGGSQLEYIELSYAHNGANIEGEGVMIRNSTLHDSLWSCIDIFSVNNIIENNEVYHCWHQGIGLKKDGLNLIKNNRIHDSQVGINCEFGARPDMIRNSLEAAPINPECGRGVDNTEESREPDSAGGMYNGALIYPSRDLHLSRD